jgi:hypothetical protein
VMPATRKERSLFYKHGSIEYNMEKKFSDDEIQSFIAMKDNPFDEKLREIVSIFNEVNNTGVRSSRIYFSMEDYEESDDHVALTLECTYSDGDTTSYLLHVPKSMLNMDDNETREWFTKRIKEIALRVEITKKEKEIKGKEESIEELLVAFGHLQDPGWIRKRLELVNSMINDKNKEKTVIESKVKLMKMKLDPGYDKSADDEWLSFIKSPPFDNVRSLIPGWRDICNKDDD